jgi:hypothetical protein
VDNDTLMGILVGSMCVLGVLAAIATLVLGTVFKTHFGINLGTPTCSECGTTMPSVVRIPKTPNQVMYGGWTCEKCGLELDKWGNPY